MFVCWAERYEMKDQTIIIRLANLNDVQYVGEILKETEMSALARGTGIAKRSADMVACKMRDGKAVIALTDEGQWVGFSYIQEWENEKYVSNSGLIVSPPFRKTGVARAIKERIFKLSREKYPDARIFSITTGFAVMKMNAGLGFTPVPYSEITHDPKFWEGCKSCVNHHILAEKGCTNCLCTAMLFDPEQNSLDLDQKTVMFYHLKIA